MKTIVLAGFIALSFSARAQKLTDTIIVVHDNKTDTFTTVQVEAKFPGGDAAWRNFLVEHIHSNTPAKHKAPPGLYTVTVAFLVDKEGKVTQPEIITDPGYGTADDVLKAFKHMPAWIPARQNGKPVFYREKQNVTYQVAEK